MTKTLPPIVKQSLFKLFKDLVNKILSTSPASSIDEEKRDAVKGKSFLPTFPVAPTIAIIILIKVLLLF